jgi:hypothetical protein
MTRISSQGTPPPDLAFDRGTGRAAGGLAPADGWAVPSGSGVAAARGRALVPAVRSVPPHDWQKVRWGGFEVPQVGHRTAPGTALVAAADVGAAGNGPAGAVPGAPWPEAGNTAPHVPQKRSASVFGAAQAGQLTMRVIAEPRR